MEALAALSSTYANSDSSDEDEDTNQSEDSTLHLKPLEKNTNSAVISVKSAPLVVSDVSFIVCCIYCLYSSDRL